MDKTQFVRIDPGDLLPEDDVPFDSGLLPPSAARRRALTLAVLLGLLAGAALLLVLVGLSRARH